LGAEFQYRRRFHPPIGGALPAADQFQAEGRIGGQRDARLGTFEAIGNAPPIARAKPPAQGQVPEIPAHLILDPPEPTAAFNPSRMAIAAPITGFGAIGNGAAARPASEQEGAKPRHGLGIIKGDEIMAEAARQHALPPIKTRRWQIGAAAAIAEQILIAVPKVEMQQIRLTGPEAERHAGAQHAARAACPGKPEPAGTAPMGRRWRRRDGRGGQAKRAAAGIIRQAGAGTEEKARSALQARARIASPEPRQVGKSRIITRPDAG
jgi:hypothetical protein